MNKIVPFISITDFTTRDQVYDMMEIAIEQNHKGRPFIKLGVGVMMSYKTLRGLPTKFTTVFPENHKIGRIFLPDSLLFNVLHYADYTETDFAKSLQLARTFAGYCLNAIQLDMIWPDPKVLADFREKHPEIQLILQIGTKAFEVIENNPTELIKKLKVYGQSLDYILLDKSMGQGKAMEAMALMPFLEKLSKEKPELGLVVAGGLGPETLHLVKPIIQKIPQVSLDAQGKLRPSGSALDPIDWDMAGQYLERAFALFAK